MIWGAVLEFLKKYWLDIVVALAVAAALAVIYHWIYARGFHARDKEVATLQAEAMKWHNAYDAQEKTIAAERKAHEEALAQLKTDQASIITGLKGQLDEALQRAAKVRVVIQHDIQRITPAIDAAYPLPVALVRVHDDAALADGAAQAPALAASDARDDGAPSGVTASAAARIIASNYAECVARREVILAWQTWYTQNKAAWEAAVKTQSSFTKVDPGGPALSGEPAGIAPSGHWRP